MYKNLLIIKLRYIGDVLLASAVFGPLRQKYSQARIVALVNPGTQSIISHNPYIDEILQVPRSDWKSQMRFLREIRSRQFDCVLDLTDGDRAALITAVTGAGTRIGFDHEHRLRRFAYTTCISASYGTMHMVDYHALVLKALGIEVSPDPPHVFITEKEEREADRLLGQLGIMEQKWVMIHPAARYWFKAWPGERFAALADALEDLGYAVVCVGQRGDEGTVERIQQSARSNVLSLVGRIDLLLLAALMKRCQLFIGNDAGPMHIAAGVGCSVVALFGPSDPAIWGPRGTNACVIYKGMDCRQCFHPDCFRKEDQCMKQISVEEVLNAATRLLDKDLC